ncbi:MAG: hypothetical protein F4Y02_03435 [Chloroflexi bacterium]|nr:hypothetical protein [Chloroflexota bacterium]
MHFLTQRRNLNATELLIGAAFIVVALFAWNQQSTVVDPDGAGVENWRWQLWQIGTLVFAAAGAAWFWSNGQSQPRIRTLAMVLLTLVIFLNTYTDDVFGDHVGSVWEVVDGLFVTLAAVVGLSLLRSGCNRGRFLAAASAITGVLVFINYLFINNETLWSALDPIMMLVALLWAVVGLSPAIGGPWEVTETKEATT